MASDARIGRRLKLRDLHTLQAVVSAGSMAKAAADLAVTQSAISKAIADMERTLGVVLLDRNPRGVEPTACGRILLERGATMFDELTQGLREIAFLADPASGELRIGTTEPMAPIATAAIDRLSRRYPRVPFHVLAADTTTLLRALRDRSLDVVVSRMTRPTAEPDLDAEVLFHDPLVVLGGPGVPWVRRGKLALADLKDQRWILGPPDGFLMTFIIEAFRANDLEVPPATVITMSMPVRMSLLASGAFLTMLPRAVLADPAWPRAVKPLPIALPATERPIGLITLKRRSLSPIAR